MTAASRSERPVAPGATPMGLRDRVLAARDSLLANPSFQRFAAAFPLTRWVARRRAARLFDLCAGFVYSQILLSCVRLKLFDQLRSGPIGVDELSTRLAMPRDSMRLLLDAAVSLHLVQRRSGGRYGLGPAGAELLGNPGVAAMVEHHAMLYRDLADPLALLRRQAGAGELASYWAYAKGGATAELLTDAVAPYTALMSASQPMIAREVLHAYAFRDHRCLLDVGGGDGAFVSAIAAHAPNLECMLFDLPAVADKAAQRFAASGLSSRARAIGGSFLTDSLPRGADIISLIRIIHDHDDRDVIILLRAVAAALPPGGTLLIAEPISGTSGAESIGDAYFAFYLLAMGSGRPRTFEQLQAMLRECGFCEIRLRPSPMPMVASVITAAKTVNSVNLA